MDDQENVVAVYFSAFGPDPAIPSLPILLGCASYGTPLNIGDPRPDGKGIAESNYVAVTVIPEYEPVEASLEQLAQWLCHHGDRLSQLDAQKTLEFQSFISPEIGSKFLHIPLEIVRLCAEAECKIAHQYLRVVTKEEHETHRSKG